MQDQPKPIPAWQRVFNLPELCDIVLSNLQSPDLARLSRVSHDFHSLSEPRLWYSIAPINDDLGLPLPQDIEAHGPFVREVRFHLAHLQPDVPVVENVRLHCQNLQTVQLKFFGHSGVTKIFQNRVFGVSHEVLDEVYQPYLPEPHHYFTEIGTAIMLEFCRLLQVDAAKNNSCGKGKLQEAQQQYTAVWYRPLIPSSPTNGFLSSTIRSLDLATELVNTDHVLAWLTRAGWEGHLQGLVQLQLNNNDPHQLYSSNKIQRELFLQCLEAFPRLSEFIAPQLQVVADAVRPGNRKSRIHADILDPLDGHPMARNLAARRHRPLKIQKLTLWSLGLRDNTGEISHSSSSSSSSSLLSTQEPWSSLLCRFPYLTDLNFVTESIPDLVSALNHRLRGQQHQALTCDDNDNIINNGNKKDKGGYGPFTATAIEPITSLTLRKCGLETGVTASSMLSSWRSLLLSPALQLETLDMSNMTNHSMPLELLDHLATSSSIKSLKRFLCCSYGGYKLAFSSVQRFFRSAIDLEEFECPRTSIVIEEFFTPEESARWPCRDRLRSLKIYDFDVDLQGSEIHSAQMRRWVWSFGPRLKELVVMGIHATVDVLLDPSSCSSSLSLSSPATPLLSPLPPRCLEINKLTLPLFQESSVLTLNQTKFRIGGSTCSFGSCNSSGNSGNSDSSGRKAFGVKNQRN
ncbi:hypothetical protein BGZ83_005212 [Gryganskiella cystojenkinii]|nr:hypothetical protein BGZ83_005212 [Gryganskiella cystojenkinii]